MPKILQGLRGSKRKVKKTSLQLTELQEAILLADVSRLMGNPDWKQTFNRLGTNETILALGRVCNEAVLDLSYINMR